MEENSLISELESSDSRGLLSLFSDFLQPFSDLINPKKTKRSTKPKDDPKTLARSLAKKFLPFLNRALGILPKRLSDSSKLGGGEQLAFEFFEIYRLCLDCLGSVSSQLLCKPYSVHVQRIRMVHCLEAWGRWKDAEAGCFWVLQRFREIDFGSKAVKSERNCLLPNAEKAGDDKEFGCLVVEVAVTLVKCVSMSQSKDGDDYGTVIRLVEELRPWFRVLDANTYEKLHRVLVTYLGKCAIFLVGDPVFVDKDFAQSFCFTTMAEYARSSNKGDIYKFAHRMCSSLFSLQENRTTFIIDMLMCVLDSLTHEGKVELENNGIEFVELVAYCANKCQATGPNCCSTIGAHLNKIADQVKTPFHLILRLYAIGLLCMSCKLRFQCNDPSSSGGVVRTLCAEDVLENLTSLLCSLRSHFHHGCKESCVFSRVDRKDFVCQQCSPCISYNEASMGCAHKDGKAYILSYLTALKFTCLPLAELVNSEKKQIINESEAVAVSSRLCGIQEAFYQFCDVFFFFKRFKSTYEGEKEGFDENSFLGIAVALFIVSVRTKLNIKKSVHLLNDVISSEWIQPYGLKHLFTSLYNIGVILYRNKQLEEALKALKLSCRASQTCVLRHCDMFLQKQDGSNDDLSEDAIVNFVNESCTRSAFLLNVLHQSDSQKVKRVIFESLENWSVAANLFTRLPAPRSLVKQWVKIECASNKNVDVADTVSTLYSALLSSKKVSKRTIGIILEQELLAYEEVNALHPELCQKMQMQIIGYLLDDVYATPESWLESSRTLVSKGRTLRFYGHCLKDCIQCLSDAISSLQKAMSGDRCSFDIQPCHQLAVACCIRAFCTQEAEPNSKQVFQDIGMALKLWLSITTPDYFAAEDKCYVVSENMIILLYNIIDLLSLKGCMDFHHDIYRLMFRLFQWKNVSLEKFVAVLWECRRLRHALCVSPVNEAFLMSLADHCGGQSKSIDFWISCLKGSQSLLVGFEHNFSFLFANISQDSFNRESSFHLDITVDQVKDAAFELISSVPASTSAYVAGYLFFDLSERLISNGRITEALTYAKEAHRLRSKMFEEKFRFSAEQQLEKSNETRDVGQKFTCSLKDLQVRRSVANEFWSFDTTSLDMESCYLSPWIILQCYLESTLQVGIAHELIGNGADAEGYFVWGKSISSSQNLPLFMASFSSVLGKLYCRKQLWDLAERELHSAKQYLEDYGTQISCLKCRLMLEITVHQHLADLSQSITDNSIGRTSSESSSRAEVLYKEVLDKLNHSDWEACTSFLEAARAWSILLEKNHVQDADNGASNAFAGTKENQQDIKKPSRNGPKENKEVRKCRKTRNASNSLLTDQDSIPENNSRTTRSKSRSSNRQSISSGAEVGNVKQSRGSGENECSGTFSQRNMLLEIKSCKVAFGCEEMCICNNMRCWHCLQVEAIKNGLLNNFIDMKWEFVRRRLLLNLLTSLGNCLESYGQIHEAHRIFIHSMLILVSQDSFHLTASYVPLSLLLDMVRKGISEDLLSVERAEILYSISWFSLKGYHSRDSRVICCDMSHVQLPQLVAWLMHVFVLCYEVPALLQKVSRLLAVVFLFAASGDLCSLSSSCKVLSENHWASFFHQASLGSHLDYQFSTNHSQIHKAQHLANAEDSCCTGSTCVEEEMRNLLRLAPKSTEDLEEFVENFFVGFPCTTAICISLLGGPYAYFLQELLDNPLYVRAWMLVSRLDSESHPIVLLLPVDSISEEASVAAGEYGFHNSKSKNLGKHWQCPWGSTIINHVAPEFKLILEENYLSSSMFPLENTKESTKLWWTSRKKLDHRLGKFLRSLEDSWLGPWKYILLGERSNCKSLDLVSKKLARSLKSKCKMDLNDSLLKVILGAPNDAFEEEEFILQLCLRKGCYIGRIESCEKDEKLTGLALQLIREAVNELEGEGCMDREPIVLVLDFDVQMLPWENIPILRNQEVYRMPSVWTISARLDRSYHNQEQTRTFPFIDPLDAFYLLNPGGDLGSTQIEFENWFRDQNFEGKAGHAPTAEELASALKSHDLFLYFGHGSGTQYISRHEIQKLENCAATLLMGCSSGSLTLNGCYAPNGAPLSYLLAGSPVIVANLWEVTDKDIDRFGKAVLDAWFKERLNSSTDCAKCSLVAELEALSLRGRKGNAKKKLPRKKLPEACEKDSVANRCDHRPMVGSFMGQAREACILPYLIGASPVCYGVPTGIRNKKDS